MYVHRQDTRQNRSFRTCVLGPLRTESWSARFAQPLPLFKAKTFHNDVKNVFKHCNVASWLLKPKTAVMSQARSNKLYTKTSISKPTKSETEKFIENQIKALTTKIEKMVRKTNSIKVQFVTRSLIFYSLTGHRWRWRQEKWGDRRSLSQVHNMSGGRGQYVICAVSSLPNLLEMRDQIANLPEL